MGNWCRHRTWYITAAPAVLLAASVEKREGICRYGVHVSASQPQPTQCPENGTWWLETSCTARIQPSSAAAVGHCSGPSSQKNTVQTDWRRDCTRNPVWRHLISSRLWVCRCGWMGNVDTALAPLDTKLVKGCLSHGPPPKAWTAWTAWTAKWPYCESLFTSRSPCATVALARLPPQSQHASIMNPGPHRPTPSH